MGFVVLFFVGALSVAGIAAMAVAFGRSGSNAERRKRLAAGGVTPDQDETLRGAQRELAHTRTLLYGFKSPELKEQATIAIEKAEKLVDAMRSQPEEIRRNNQFFSYYVPTIGVVLQKYTTLENSNTLQNDELLQKAIEHMQDMAHAFDLIRDNMYKDEALDLDVEIDAMKMALSREGLA